MSTRPRPYQPPPGQPRHYQPGPPPRRYPPVPVPPPAHRMVTTRPMGAAAEVFHWTMILLTGGLWIPVYIAAKRARKTITTWQ